MGNGHCLPRCILSPGASQIGPRPAFMWPGHPVPSLLARPGTAPPSYATAPSPLLNLSSRHNTGVMDPRELDPRLERGAHSVVSPTPTRDHANHVSIYATKSASVPSSNTRSDWLLSSFLPPGTPGHLHACSGQARPLLFCPHDSGFFSR